MQRQLTSDLMDRQQCHHASWLDVSLTTTQAVTGKQTDRGTNRNRQRQTDRERAGAVVKVTMILILTCRVADVKFLSITE